MAALSASDVSYVQPAKGSVADNGHKVKLLTISFGDGAKTYPAGGVDLSGLSAQGFPNQVIGFTIVDPASANGFVYKFDSANKKLRIYQGDNANVAAAPLIELAGSAAPAAASLKVSVSGY